jgi:hypothetical protein
MPVMRGPHVRGADLSFSEYRKTEQTLSPNEATNRRTQESLILYISMAYLTVTFLSVCKIAQDG